MCNSIFLADKSFPKGKDGQPYEATIKGFFVEEDGERKFDVTHVDGVPVRDPEESDCGCGEEHEDLMNQDADDALRIFMIKTKKG